MHENPYLGRRSGFALGCDGGGSQGPHRALREACVLQQLPSCPLSPSSSPHSSGPAALLLLRCLTAGPLSGEEESSLMDGSAGDAAHLCFPSWEMEHWEMQGWREAGEGEQGESTATGKCRGGEKASSDAQISQVAFQGAHMRLPS